ncbi:arylsulfatase [Sphingomonas sp. C3-2]|uniref:arylsulfatase n=1 Tax=Sphingomonas sp. C3-2 TaxID=3062169 RepID=UPI00294B1CF1|nr:arylsulfatase [Sphingomonas sp. C3-2]WOK36683.1 arylsulfatase [Sphingomonas sp. C3-2]
MFSQASVSAQGTLPLPPSPFAGKIGNTYSDSTPSFPKPITAPDGAPNIFLILTDDVGFGAASTFGGPIATPNLDRLAKRGLVYNRFHTTAMCSPTRAALLTGRNHHAVGNAVVSDIATGYPGYWSVIPRSAATVAEVLRQSGYNTAMLGKHHNIPMQQTSQAGPFDQWPTGLGFEQFYGFLGGDTEQWTPKLYRGNAPAEQKYDKDPSYILDRDLADEAISYIHGQKAAAPNKPFFLYYAPGTAHAPHQAPEEWIAKFKGQFDKGWDVIRSETLKRQIAMKIAPAGTKDTPRLKDIPAWSSLNPDQKRLYSRMMEVYAGMLAYQDAQFGRVLDELDRMGESGNTLVMFIEGDNGASTEGSMQGSTNELGTFANGATEDMAYLNSMLDKLGGKDSYGHFPVGWAWAINGPFPWAKQIASHLGGTRNGLVVSWPDRIKTRGVRSQFTHVVDVMPTILEAVGINAPDSVNGEKQQRVDGISFAYSFDAPSAPEQHETQYFEMIGTRAIYHKGWFASTTPARVPWVMGASDRDAMHYDWELYDLSKDFSQANNIAAKHPEKLSELKALWTSEAQRNQVFPIDDRQTHDRSASAKIAFAPRRKNFVYWGKGISVADTVAPPIRGRSFRIVANVDIPQGGGNGAIVASGSKFGGWSFYLDNGRPAVHMAFTQQPAHQSSVIAKEVLPAGPAQVVYDFDYDGGGYGRGGLMRISIGDREVARGRIDRTVLVTAGLGETFDIGDDTGATVIDYPGDKRFNGGISKVEVFPK